MDLGVRRIILAVVSIAGGIGLTFGLLAVLDLAYSDVNLERYGITYAILTAIPLMVLVGVWLDFFLKTNLLSEGPAPKSSDESKTE